MPYRPRDKVAVSWAIAWICALYVSCGGEPASTPDDRSEPDAGHSAPSTRPALCDRAGDDLVRDLFCGPKPTVKRGAMLAPPHYDERATDPDKLTALSASYQRYLQGEIDADDGRCLHCLMSTDNRQGHRALSTRRERRGRRRTRPRSSRPGGRPASVAPPLSRAAERGRSENQRFGLSDDVRCNRARKHRRSS